MPEISPIPTAALELTAADVAGRLRADGVTLKALAEVMGVGFGTAHRTAAGQTDPASAAYRRLLKAAHARGLLDGDESGRSAA